MRSWTAFLLRGSGPEVTVSFVVEFEDGEGIGGLLVGEELATVLVDLQDGGERIWPLGTLRV